MRELAGRVAVVTGGGSGIGRALVLAFARERMHVVAADVEAARAEETAEAARALGVRALAVGTDVTSREAVQALADRAFAEFGAVHILCNNAGISVFRPLDAMSDADWRWTLAVNLEGVVHGLQAFLPRMLQQGDEGHIVNTGSIAGLYAIPGRSVGAYGATKFAVVGLSENLRLDLADTRIGVSVLCPGGVRTGIVFAGRNRPQALGPAEAPPERTAEAIARGMDPAQVVALVLAAIRENELYIVTHPETRAAVEARCRALTAAYDRLERLQRAADA